jgi:hypothetical protein
VGDGSAGQSSVCLDQLCNPYSPIRCRPILTNSVGSRGAQSLSGVPRVLPLVRHHRTGVDAGLGRGEVGGPDVVAAPDPHRRQEAGGNPVADDVARDPGALRGLRHLLEPAGFRIGVVFVHDRPHLVGSGSPTAWVAAHAVSLSGGDSCRR